MVSSLLSMVISNSKQVDFTKAVTKWLMYDVTYILKLKQNRLELLDSLLITYTVNV